MTTTTMMMMMMTMTCMAPGRGRLPTSAGAMRPGLATLLAFTAARTVAAGACPLPSVETLFLEGDPAPGTGQSFQTFDRPIRSSNGAVFFAADTDGSTAADDVVYVNSTLIAREGDPAPGVVGGLYGPFEFFETQQQVNVAGDVVYITTLRETPSGEDRALYSNASLIAQRGMPAAGVPARTFNDFGFAGIADDGSVGFLADLDGSTSDDSAIYLGGAVLYREGDPVPTMTGEMWDGNFDEVQFNGSGDVLFEGNTSLPSAGDIVLFRRLRDVGGAPVESIVAQEGQAVDAHTGPDSLAGIAQTALAENGAWALRGTLGAAPVGSDDFIMSEAGVVAQQGDAVSGLAGAFLGTLGALGINSIGDVVYIADLEGATPPGVDEGLFVNGCLLTTTGSPVPGLAEGTVFTDFGFEDVSMNDTGAIVFAASFGGADVGDGLFTLTVDMLGACPADVDGNGDVGFGDLLTILGAWGPCPASCPSDLDGDGAVGISDLQEAVAAWGPCSGAA